MVSASLSSLCFQKNNSHTTWNTASEISAPQTPQTPQTCGGCFAASASRSATGCNGGLEQLGNHGEQVDVNDGLGERWRKPFQGASAAPPVALPGLPPGGARSLRLRSFCFLQLTPLLSGGPLQKSFARQNSRAGFALMVLCIRCLCMLAHEVGLRGVATSAI